jgi:undecaprenyl-diphosphatase
VGAVLALGAGFAFLELAEEVRQGDVDAFDTAVLSWLAERRSPRLDALFLAVTALGSAPVLGVLTAGVVLPSFLARRLRPGLTLLVAVLGAAALSKGLKLVYGRPRPTLVPHLETVASASFPSGHTLASVAFFSTLALLAAEQAPRRRLRVFFVTYSLFVGAMVAVSRVYLGVHYPSDVAGGGLVGAAWAIVVLLVAREIERRKGTQAGLASQPTEPASDDATRFQSR